MTKWGGESGVKGGGSLRTIMPTYGGITDSVTACVAIILGNDIAVDPNLLYESYPLPAFGGTPPILRGERHSERNQPLIPSKHNGKIFV